MAHEEQWETRITSIEPDSIRFRGYAVDELMGSVSYASALYLLITGELPDRSTARLLEAILVSSMDHGATPPSTLAARTAASTGAPINAGLAAGILSINEYHGGAIERCMHHLEEIAKIEAGGEAKGEGAGPETTEAAARKLVVESREAGERLSGFGHRVHRADPRARRLFALAAEEGRSGSWVARASALEGALFEATGKELNINVDGAIAALLKEMDLPPVLANAIFMIARMPGLLAQIVEERTTQRPMRRVIPGADTYTGPGPRPVPDREANDWRMT